jgi:metal-dependent amidase/aminoacylase/carboxypeptidase family protein
MRGIVLVAALLAACASPTGQTTPASTGALMTQVVDRLEAKRTGLIAFRRDLHRHPELSNEEARTAGIVAARLEALGFEVQRNVGGHGVVGVLRGALPGRVIAFRADMDAVQDDSHDPVEFRSLRPGVRHICGHDVHTTIGIALAESFASIRDELSGDVVLYFQPAEEAGTGALAMIEDGAMNAPRPDAVFAVHTAPYEVGTFATSESVLMVSRDRAHVTVSGVDAPAIVQDVVGQLSALSSVERFQPQPAGVDWVNVEAWTAEASQSGRSEAIALFNLATPGARANMRQALDGVIAQARQANPNAQIEAHYQANWMPGVQNDAALTRAAMASMRAELGAGAVSIESTIIPAVSEDFGHMQAVVPGAYFFMGVSNRERGWIGMPHTPSYVADEESIFIGARALARVMLDAMQR